MICEKCNGQMWDNRAKNAERKKAGLKSMPNFSCKNKDGCGFVIWPPKEEQETSKVQEPVREPVKETDWDEVARGKIRGKIRSLFIQSHIQRNGLIPLSASDLLTLDTLVEVAMGNK